MHLLTVALLASVWSSPPTPEAEATPKTEQQPGSAVSDTMLGSVEGKRVTVIAEGIEHIGTLTAIRDRQGHRRADPG